MLTHRRAVWILTLLFTGALSLPAEAAAPTVLSGCVTPALARRTGSPGCWASVMLKTPETSQALCLSKALWRQWLEKPSSLCGNWEGKWQSFSPLMNEVGNGVGNGSMEKAAPVTSKTLVLRFHPSRLPGTEKSASLWIRSRAWIENRREELDVWLSPVDATGILSGLATGTHRPGGTLEFLLILGFVHVLSASGIHLYAMARWWSWCFEIIARKFEIPVSTALPFSRVITFTSWTASWLMAGARPGMFRPWLVILLRHGGRRLGIRWLKGTPLVLVLGIDLLIAALRHDLGFQSGRWIYCLACAGGLMAKSAAGMAIGSWVLAAIWQAWREGLSAVATPLISGLTLPIFSVAIYPLIFVSYFLKLCGLIPWAQGLAHALGWITTGLVLHLTQLVLRFSLLYELSRWSLIAGIVLGASCFFVRIRARLAVLGVFVLARLLVPVSLAAGGPPLASYVEQLDIGQGDAAFVAPAHASTGFGLIDSGPEKSMSDRAWLELLARRGIREIAWVGITHLDEDHAGGIKKLARLIPIRCVATAQAELDSERGQAYREALEPLGIHVTSWEQGCVPYPYLAPLVHGAGKANENMGAVFIPLAGGGFYLSAGDADQADEPRIGEWASRLGAGLGQPRILKISHHGSSTSSNPVFLKLMQPSEAWISSGVGNHYGHPAVSTLGELKQLKIPVWRTDQSGVLRAEGGRHPR